MNELPLESEHPSIDQVVDLLETYADARLQPRGAVLARMRRHVLAEAAARAAAEDAQRLMLERTQVVAARRASVWQFGRRLAPIGMAAAFMFATSAAVLAAPPGSPLYNARVQLEQAFLPQRLDDRVASIEQHLEERLAEAQAAADRGDVAALQASLAAYQAEVDAALAEPGWDADQLLHLEAELARHTTLLEALAARLPEQAAIEHAIDTSQKAATKLHEKSQGKPTDAGQPGPHPTPGGAPNQR
jgi:hypothetical protein